MGVGNITRPLQEQDVLLTNEPSLQLWVELPKFPCADEGFFHALNE